MGRVEIINDEIIVDGWKLRNEAEEKGNGPGFHFCLKLPRVVRFSVAPAIEQTKLKL